MQFISVQPSFRDHNGIVCFGLIARHLSVQTRQAPEFDALMLMGRSGGRLHLTASLVVTPPPAPVDRKQLQCLHGPAIGPVVIVRHAALGAVVFCALPSSTVKFPACLGILRKDFLPEMTVFTDLQARALTVVNQAQYATWRSMRRDRGTDRAGS